MERHVGGVKFISKLLHLGEMNIQTYDLTGPILQGIVESERFSRLLAQASRKTDRSGLETWFASMLVENDGGCLWSPVLTGYSDEIPEEAIRPWRERTFCDWPATPNSYIINIHFHPDPGAPGVSIGDVRNVETDAATANQPIVGIGVVARGGESGNVLLLQKRYQVPLRESDARYVHHSLHAASKCWDTPAEFCNAVEASGHVRAGILRFRNRPGRAPVAHVENPEIMHSFASQIALEKGLHEIRYGLRPKRKKNEIFGYLPRAAGI